MATAEKSWADRRGLAQKGKEVHEPGNPSPTGRKFGEPPTVTEAVRRASIDSQGGNDKTTSTASRRRRSSGISNLTDMKRGSQDYGERRMSAHDQSSSQGGLLAGWFNSTFKGHTKPAGDGEQK